MGQKKLCVDRRTLAALHDAGYVHVRTGAAYVFKDASGHTISISRTPKDADTQLREVCRDIRRKALGTYK